MSRLTIFITTICCDLISIKFNLSLHLIQLCDLLVLLKISHAGISFVLHAAWSSLCNDHVFIPRSTLIISGLSKNKFREHPNWSEHQIDSAYRSCTVLYLSKKINPCVWKDTITYSIITDCKLQVPKLKEPRSLYCVPRDVVMPRWPVGIDTVCPKPDLTHNNTPPPFNEEFYKRPSGAS